jgi:YfiR/HmsC-like
MPAGMPIFGCFVGAGLRYGRAWAPSVFSSSSSFSIFHLFSRTRTRRSRKEPSSRLRGSGAGVAPFLVALLCLARLLADAAPASAPRVANEYDLKAAFIFNLAKFIQWPAEKFAHEDSPLVIGVLGDEALDRFTSSLRDKTIDKHRLVVRRIEQAKDLPECHVLFISRPAKQQVAELVETGRMSKVLTVGETDQFLELGGMIRFTLESDELRLEINDKRARSASLSIAATALSALVNKGIAKIRDF